MQRRQFMHTLTAGLLAASGIGAAAAKALSKARVVVVGGGYAGATAAKYLRMWSAGLIEVVLIEPNASFVSSPMSNLVLGGSLQMADITQSYASLATRHGVRLIQDIVRSIDAGKRTVSLVRGPALTYDRLIIAPGVDFIWDELPGMNAVGAQAKVMHAWKAGPQTLTLRKQLEAMPDGGVFVISIPQAPFRCPPAPYERACQVANYFSRHKKKSKVLILDGNDDVLSEAASFKRAWAERYPQLVEYRPGFVTADVDAASNTVISDFDDRVQAAVLNVIPPQRAGNIAMQAGLANINKRWCEVDFLTFESTQAPLVHVLGDAIQIAPQMPKSGHMANQHGKVCAAAVIDLLNGREPNKNPLLSNTCYSFVSDKDAMHIASVHRYDAAQKTLLPVPSDSGVSAAATAEEGAFAHAWAQNIWADTLG
jgi:sulfide dehydrogenase [flavocytochrome c] flavoprotein subunit